MGNIREYDAGQIGLRPTEAGVTARAATARRIGANFNEVAGATQGLGSETRKLGQEVQAQGAYEAGLTEKVGNRVGQSIAADGEVAVKYLDHQQISAGAPALARLTAAKTNEWNETVKDADPNDPTVASKFMAGLEPELEKFRDGFLTEHSQQWAEAHVDALRNHLSTKTSADMATMAGHAAVVNQQQTINSLSTAVNSDPSSLQFALDTLESATSGVVGSSPNMDGATAARVKSEILQKGKEAIVKSAVLGMIERNPNTDLGAIEKKYGAFINGAEMRMFAKAAQSQAKTDALRQKQTDVYQRQLDQQAAHGAANKLMTDMVEIDPATQRPTIKPDFFKGALEIAKMPNAPDGLARTLIDWGEHQQNLKDTATRSDPAVKQDLVDRMFSSDKPVTEIDLMRAQIAGKLSKEDFASMSHMVKTLEESPMKGPIWKDTMDAVKSELVLNIPGLPGKDITGVSNYAKFAQSFIPQYQAAVRAGTLPPNALDMKDPESMISKAMAPFKRSQKDRLLDYTRAAGGINYGGEVPEPGTGRMVSGVPVPPALGGVAALQYNAAKQQFRDQTTGEIYDRQGNKVKP